MSRFQRVRLRAYTLTLARGYACMHADILPSCTSFVSRATRHAAQWASFRALMSTQTHTVRQRVGGTSWVCVLCEWQVPKPNAFLRDLDFPGATAAAAAPQAPAVMLG